MKKGFDVRGIPLWAKSSPTATPAVKKSHFPGAQSQSWGSRKLWGFWLLPRSLLQLWPLQVWTSGQGANYELAQELLTEILLLLFLVLHFREQSECFYPM